MGPMEKPAYPAATAPVPEARALSYLGLLTSVGTLLCCALPSLLVLLGFGATVASLVSALPWLVALSRHKAWVFTAAALLLAGNVYYLYRLAPRLLAARGVCPADDPDACARATRSSRRLLGLSALLYGVGVAVAYLLPVLLRWSEP